MADDPKRTLETFVAAAMKARVEEALRAASASREEYLAAAGRLEESLRAVADRPFELPEDLIPRPPASEEGLLSHVASSQRDLLAAADQVGLLTQLLLGCTVSCPRVALFIVKKEALVGWATRGFETAQETDVRNLTIPLSESSILAAAHRAGGPVRGRTRDYRHDEKILARLGGKPPAESMAVPIWIRDKVSAVLYGDSGMEDRITDPEIPEILAAHAGLCLETLATRQKYPRPRPGEAPAATAPAADVSGPQPSLSASGPITMVGAPAAAAPPPAAPAAPPSAPSMPAASAAPAVRTAAALPSLEGLPDEERKLHEEARRFARLLVSEIVLYNERQVEEGRRQKDLYERLKEDIDRSLGMYQQRVNPKVRATTNYFYLELVRTLANGDESAIKVPWA